VGGAPKPGAVVPSVVVKPPQAEEEKKTAASVKPPEEKAKEPSLAEQEEKLKEAAQKINEFVESISHDLQFTVDKDTNRMVVKVVERKSGEVIRQIPSEETLEIAKALDTLKGLIIRKKA
jgi:flagellar protein FlaG